MPKENNNVLKQNHGEKSMTVSFIIDVDIESLLEKINGCHNNPEKSSNTEINEYTPSGYSFFTHCSFYATKNKLSFYRGKDCMNRLCKDLRKEVIKIINYETK